MMRLTAKSGFISPPIMNSTFCSPKKDNEMKSSFNASPNQMTEGGKLFRIMARKNKQSYQAQRSPVLQNLKNKYIGKTNSNTQTLEPLEINQYLN